ncbi:MAG: transcriptional regulator [Treponema sp.]|nr:transcriptional regulator [Treponema sp.]
MNLQQNERTEEDFLKARNKAFFNEIQHLLNPEEAKLIALSDVKNLIKPSAETYLGMKVIPVEKIIGSEGRYQDFDNNFFPKSSHLRTRWEKIDDAAIRSIVLPPIKVYEIAGLYFVRDGNHRVSVAKSRGTEFIDAEVVSLQSEITIKNANNINDLIRQIINFEKRTFYMETSFGDITDYWVMDFTTPGKYDLIYNHIITHKYYINMNQSEEISWDDAVLSWFKNVYLPVIHYLEDNKVMKHFRKRTESDLYVWIMKYWDQLKTKYGNDVPINDAVAELEKNHKVPLRKKILNYFKRIVLQKSYTPVNNEEI